MGSKEKLIERFKRQPRNFTWQEFVRLFGSLGFELDNKGASSGSRVAFLKGDLSFLAHKPHPDHYMKGYMMSRALKFLENNNLI